MDSGLKGDFLGVISHGDYETELVDMLNSTWGNEDGLGRLVNFNINKTSKNTEAATHYMTQDHVDFWNYNILQAKSDLPTVLLTDTGKFMFM